jgi:hypothetical protein
MAEEPATNTYLIAEPFDQAVKSLRAALTAAHLRIVEELNISRRIRRELGMNTVPCLVLLMIPAAPEGLDLLADPCAVALTPLHIVISARADHTEMHVMRFPPKEAGGLSRPAVEAFGRMQIAISQAVEKIGMRTNLTA